MNLWFALSFGAYLLTCVLSDCTFKDMDHQDETEARRRLATIEKELVRTSITEDSADGYIYNIGVCTPALVDRATEPNYKTAGVTQFNKTKPQDNPIVIGRINSTSVMAGANWVYLEYSDGEKYHQHHCSGEKRTASIMFICAQGVSQPRARIVEENNIKTKNCYYLFEVETDSACPPVKEESPELSAGSIICIIALVIIGIYLIGGAIYQRVMVGAKGMEQIPNYAFWQDFGNLQADGCDLICRSGSRTRGSREYRGIGDDQIHQSVPDDVSHDDNLLPM